MNTTRSVSPGKSRRCPHCRSEILESASVCPICRHHLRFGKAAELPGKRFSALNVEGTLRHPAGEDPWEYSVLIAVRNQKGEEVARHADVFIFEVEVRSQELDEDVDDFGIGIRQADGIPCL